MGAGVDHTLECMLGVYARALCMSKNGLYMDSSMRCWVRARMLNATA